MGLSASQGRLLLLTAKKSDLEYRAQQIAMLRAILCQEQEAASREYEDATSNRVMSITLASNAAGSTTNIPNDKVTENLTYRALVSGTVSNGPGATIAGIQASKGARTEDYEYTSTKFYRLMSADGAIVVSDVGEIPTATESVTKTDATELKGEQFGKNAYQITNTASDGSEVVSYGVLAPDGSDLRNLIDDNNKTASIKIDIENGVVEYEDEDGTFKYYDIATGADITGIQDENKTYTFVDGATLYSSFADIPKSVTSSVNKEGNYVEGPGPDGVATLKNSKGVPIQRYIVDPALKDGYFDSESGISDINYLQECLRNGKYLIQKLDQNENLESGWRWSDISWDTASNITDSYYTDDDATAKAKYDRIQSQIQAQDKKLELELDNIETQRSAVTTEIESVQKVIDENIEGSFNAFG